MTVCDDLRFSIILHVSEIRNGDWPADKSAATMMMKSTGRTDARNPREKHNNITAAHQSGVKKKYIQFSGLGTSRMRL